MTNFSSLQEEKMNDKKNDPMDFNARDWSCQLIYKSDTLFSESLEEVLNLRSFERDDLKNDIILIFESLKSSNSSFTKYLVEHISFVNILFKNNVISQIECNDINFEKENIAIFEGKGMKSRTSVSKVKAGKKVLFRSNINELFNVCKNSHTINCFPLVDPDL